MIIKNRWKSCSNSEIEKNNSLKELSNLWSSQITVTTTKPSIIKDAPVKYTEMKK